MQEVRLETLTPTPHPRVVVQKTVSKPWRWLKEKIGPIWRGIPRVHLMVNIVTIVALVAVCTLLGLFGLVAAPALIWLSLIFYGIVTFGQFLFSLLIDSVR